METFGTDDIQRAVGHVSFLRGLDYFERGMVRSVEFVSPGRIHGEVSGSRQKPYAVVAKYEPGSEGRFLPVEGHCSCPVGYNCKHAAAVLLAARHLSPDGDDSGSGAAREGVSGVVRRWLDRWPKAAAGNRKRFTAEFRTPIEKHGDRARQRLLSTRVKPFLMRRTKEEVAPELPEKTVIDELVPLEGAQAALYESIRTAMDKRIREAIAARGLAASRIAVLDALLKLRQVCCDPGLVRLDAARKVKESAKRARLMALLEELVAEGRKVLVFSQFVKMLKLVEHDVAARGWGYAMLHGRTKDRDAQVANFQSGDLPLFLVSLKAGGTGLNLTAADTVIVYDPWWNPAVERQAMDRAHRIGQDKPVFVHRLIAENTVEAAIQRMQARKPALADALFEGTGQGPLALTEEDIHALFGPG